MRKLVRRPVRMKNEIKREKLNFKRKRIVIRYSLINNEIARRMITELSLFDIVKKKKRKREKERSKWNFERCRSLVVTNNVEEGRK